MLAAGLITGGAAASPEASRQPVIGEPRTEHGCARIEEDLPELTGWPKVESRVKSNPSDERRVKKLLAGMTLAEKVGQMTQPEIGSITPDSAAADVGLRPGDVITSIDRTPVYAFDQVYDVVGASDGTPLALGLWRAGETLTVEVSPRRTDLPLREGGFENRWLIGIAPGPLFEVETTTPGPFSAIEAATAANTASGARRIT